LIFIKDFILPATVELREDGHVIYFMVTEPWTLDDLIAVNQKAAIWVEYADHTVHLLGNAERIEQMPDGIMSIHRVAPVSHPNSGYVAIVGASALVKSFTIDVLRLANFSRLKFFDEEDSAWAFLRDTIEQESGPKPAAYHTSAGS
jgi:hypothetical protein